MDGVEKGKWGKRKERGMGGEEGRQAWTTNKKSFQRPCEYERMDGQSFTIDVAIRPRYLVVVGATRANQSNSDVALSASVTRR